MSEQSREAQRTAFGTAVDASDYGNLRPGYPERIVDWALGFPHRRLRVLDLGAGTGILAKDVIDRGHEVVAVDPSEDMLTEFRRRLPEVTAQQGQAEQIPLDDASVDAVVCGQSWHWVDEPKAWPEIARVLRPGGWFAVLWNVRDESEPWVRELAEIAGRPKAVEAGGDRTTPPHPQGPFGELEHTTVENSMALGGPDDLETLVRTWSYVQLSERQGEIVTATRALAQRVAGPDRTFTVPQRCDGYRVRKLLG